MLPKILNFIKERQSEVILVLVIIMTTVISFNLGRISERNRAKTPITITSSMEVASRQDRSDTKAIANQKNIRDTNSPVVASKKSSSHLYHFSWCSGASKIAEKNKLTFPNELAAIAAGYSLASNCEK